MAKGKKSNKFLMFLLVFIVLLVVFKNQIAKFGVITAVKAVTGLKLDIYKLHIGLFDSKIQIKDLRLYNPEEFSDPIMLNMPEIYVDYSILPIFKGKMIVDEIRINMEEFAVIKNENGDVNLNSLKVVKESKGEEGKPSDQKPKAESAGLKLIVKTLDFKVGRVVYKDYQNVKDGQPSIKEYKLNIDEHYENIPNLAAVVSIIVVKTMAKTTIASIANLDLNGLSSNVSTTLKAATGMATKILGDTTGKSKEILDSTTDTIKEKAEGLKSLIKNPLKN